MIKNYIVAPDCISQNNKHSLTDAKSPYFAQCEICGEYFYLISEKVFKESGIQCTPRLMRGN